MRADTRDLVSYDMGRRIRVMVAKAKGWILLSKPGEFPVWGVKTSVRVFEGNRILVARKDGQESWVTLVERLKGRQFGVPGLVWSVKDVVKAEGKPLAKAALDKRRERKWVGLSADERAKRERQSRQAQVARLERGDLDTCQYRNEVRAKAARAARMRLSEDSPPRKSQSVYWAAKILARIDARAPAGTHLGLGNSDYPHIREHLGSLAESDAWERRRQQRKE